MRRVLITGAAGFIGSSLVDALLDMPDVEVIGVDSMSDYYDNSLKELNLADALGKGLDLHRSDLLSLDLPALLDGVDVIFHQAGQPGVRPSWGNSFQRYVTDNVLATQVLLEAAAKSKHLTRFVFASSSSVYGDAERYPTLESDRPQPRSPYGVTKLAAEHLCGLYASNLGVPSIALRYFTVYGPRQRPDMAFTKFIGRGLLSLSLPLYGDGQAVRDFTYIDDVISANLAAAVVPHVTPGTVINVSGGSNASLSEVFAHIEAVIGQPLKIDRLPSVPGDVARTGGSSELAEQLLGWRPQVTLADGIGRQAAWLRDSLGAYADQI